MSRHEIQIERIDTAPWTPHADETFGRALAAMHRLGAPSFGAPADGYIGPLPLDNTPADDWPDVLRRRDGSSRTCGRRSTRDRCRARRRDVRATLRPHRRDRRSARSRRLASTATCGAATSSRTRDGSTWVIDPAAHGGHRETDLAMMRLFGGFGSRCYAAYDEAAPLAPGHEDRVALHQLHPLLVHAVLFGGGYGADALRAARRYVG